MNIRFVLSVAVAWSLMSAAASAAPIVYDFQGTGYLYSLETGEGVEALAFTGTVTIDVLASGPAGSNTEISPGYAFDQNGWVSSAFTVEWAGGSFASRIVAGETGHYEFASAVTEEFGAGFESLVNAWQSVRDDPYGVASEVNYAVLVRSTLDELSWLDDLIFSERGLAPGAATNFLQFEDYTYGTFGIRGITGRVDLTSMQARVTQVSEPGALALLAAGLAVIWPLRRRR